MNKTNKNKNVETFRKRHKMIKEKIIIQAGQIDHHVKSIPENYIF